jgi:hypothetical protein
MVKEEGDIKDGKYYRTNPNRTYHKHIRSIRYHIKNSFKKTYGYFFGLGSSLLAANMTLYPLSKAMDLVTSDEDKKKYADFKNNLIDKMGWSKGGGGYFDFDFGKRRSRKSGSRTKRKSKKESKRRRRKSRK